MVYRLLQHYTVVKKMKTKPIAVRVPLALATSLERQAERESVTVADVIRHILAKSQQSEQDKVIDALTSLASQMKLLRQGQTQIIYKLNEFEIENGEEK